MASSTTILETAPDSWDGVPAWIVSLTPEEARTAGIAAIVERIDDDQDVGDPIPARMLYISLSVLRDRMLGRAIDQEFCQLGRDISPQRIRPRSCRRRTRPSAILRDSRHAGPSPAQAAVLRALLDSPTRTAQHEDLADLPGVKRYRCTLNALVRYGLVRAGDALAGLTPAGQSVARDLVDGGPA